jgi:hypothetical protein
MSLSQLAEGFRQQVCSRFERLRAEMLFRVNIHLIDNDCQWRRLGIGLSTTNVLKLASMIPGFAELM